MTLSKNLTHIMKKTTILLASILFLILSKNSYAQSTGTGYAVSKKIHLPGNSWWDYLTVDPSTGHLFVSHGNMVLVVNVNSGSVIKRILNTPGVHGIALAQDLNKGFISDGANSSVTVFNLKTLAVRGKIGVTGRDPDGILYDPFTQRVMTFNGRTSNVTVIDAKTEKVVGTIPLDGRPEFAVSDGEGHVFDNIESKSEIAEINPKTMKVEREWSIAPGKGPSHLAIDKSNHLLFSVCHNGKMVVSDAIAGRVITTLPIGRGSDGAAFDPKLKRAFSSNGEGTLTVVQEEGNNHFKVLGNLPTQAGARTITIDTENHHLYLPTASFKPVPKGEHHRPQMIPNSFVVLDIKPVN